MNIVTIELWARRGWFPIWERVFFKTGVSFTRNLLLISISLRHKLLSHNLLHSRRHSWMGKAMKSQIHLLSKPNLSTNDWLLILKPNENLILMHNTNDRMFDKAYVFQTELLWDTKTTMINYSMHKVNLSIILKANLSLLGYWNFELLIVSWVWVFCLKAVNAKIKICCENFIH